MGLIDFNVIFIIFSYFGSRNEIKSKCFLYSRFTSPHNSADPTLNAFSQQMARTENVPGFDWVAMVVLESIHDARIRLWYKTTFFFISYFLFDRKEDSESFSVQLQYYYSMRQNKQ